ncbi:hypothetical protein OE88DRAFT_1641964 [Heliocybe sulcata]|uniref:Uncharacterized protein n=1 Tax=Heliocybe sulcata TaxID=5364 RepID=A0A5C3NJJ7_9AGAM|nr:hypothetical protein OE88DRAFT_1641964 [Heliocybe sulcata]
MHWSHRLGGIGFGVTGAMRSRHAYNTVGVLRITSKLEGTRTLKGTNTRRNPHRPKGEQQPQSVAPNPWCEMAARSGATKDIINVQRESMNNAKTGYSGVWRDTDSSSDGDREQQRSDERQQIVDVESSER